MLRTDMDALPSLLCTRQNKLVIVQPLFQKKPIFCNGSPIEIVDRIDKILIRHKSGGLIMSKDI
jgi:hypothetical protein